jgi:hypothetical protein
MKPIFYPVVPLLAFLGACESGDITLVAPDRDPGGTAVLEAQVLLEDSALAAELGWSGGVPDAAAQWAYVEHWRYLFQDTHSDSAGMLRIPSEGSGMYWIAAGKEIELDGLPRVLGGGLQTRTSGPPLTMRLDDPGSLVISEVHSTHPPPWETGGRGYFGSTYIELYNNSATTLYLDGVVLGVAYTVTVDYSANGHHSCSFTKAFREDPRVIWSRWHWRFPGSGTEHPIAPGEVVVVAASAADHTQVHPSMLDLTDAEFEFLEAGAADNPAAANMEKVWPNQGDQSNAFLLSNARWFVSAPVDLDALDTMVDDDWLYGEPVLHRGFPADAIFDVALMWLDATNTVVIDRSVPPCDYPIHPTFDALPGGYLYGEANPGDLLVSPQRRVVRVENGQRILLDTNTSAVDFENLPRTPGWIPDPMTP